MGTRREWRRVLIAVGIICSAAAIAYLLHKNQWYAKMSIISSHTSIDQQQQQLRENALVKVRSVGNFTNRVAAFNAFLTSLRLEELTKRGKDAWHGPTSRRLEVLWGYRDDYLQLLSNYTNVMTVALLWLTDNQSSPHAWSSLQDHSNLLIQTYYEWSADDTIFSWIETPGKTKLRFDAMYNRTCNRNMNDTVRPVSVEPVFLNAKPLYAGHYWPNNGSSYPERFYTSAPPYVFHMHIY